ncbi:hypothetical protein SEA_ZUKO_58 [Streptomyces phage Zuko]|uniref:Uncharacterized protein n=1 Tax=Streptomyces phage Zuko TaxID=2601695 RepID=A0A5J6D7T1_9CAUD|nr:hypothetical protein PP630_gp058 [Streptomyces phage Zuko]QEQ93636.1 hypothetical protein SEA_ZUKO_58 [Streptomyces phage Zuko]
MSENTVNEGDAPDEPVDPTPPAEENGDVGVAPSGDVPPPTEGEPPPPPPPPPADPPPPGENYPPPDLPG